MKWNKSNIKQTCKMRLKLFQNMKNKIAHESLVLVREIPLVLVRETFWVCVSVFLINLRPLFPLFFLSFFLPSFLLHLSFFFLFFLIYFCSLSFWLDLVCGGWRVWRKKGSLVEVGINLWSWIGMNLGG